MKHSTKNYQYDKTAIGKVITKLGMLTVSNNQTTWPKILPDAAL